MDVHSKFILGYSQGFEKFLLSSVVIDDLYIRCILIIPAKADTVSVLNADAVLSLTVALQRLQPISWRNLECCQTYCCIEHIQLPQCDPLTAFKPTGMTSFK